MSMYKAMNELNKYECQIIKFCILTSMYKAMNELNNKYEYQIIKFCL